VRFRVAEVLRTVPFVAVVVVVRDGEVVQIEKFETFRLR
jgi:hypothetical protein